MNNSLKLTNLAIAFIFLLMSNSLYGQAPYSLSPQFRFGAGAGLSFTNGNYPNSGAPTATLPASNPGTEGVEASTAVSDRTGSIAIYSNTMQVRNVANTTIRNLTNTGDGVCGGSSTGGGVAIPDPASPNDTYYLFIGNDITLGSCTGNGINYYKFQKNGLGQAVYLSGPTLLIASNQVDESICAGNDGQGNYWIASHGQSTNAYKIWRVDATGVTALTDQSTGPNGGGTQVNATIKISPCQNKIAWHSGTNLRVYNFNRATGAIGAQLGSWNTGIHGIGLEFSPDGNTLYASGLGTIVQWYTIGGASGTITGSNSWSMQLGPDGKIYTSGTEGSTSVGIIETPNAPATTSYSTMPISGSIFRGLMNAAWLSPELPVINNSINACTVDFEYEFQNYFLSTIGVDAGSILWNFDDGNTSTSASPSHTYTSDGTYDVTLTFNDATCGHTFTATTQVTVTCGITPPGCNLNLTAVIDPITDIEIDDKTPATIHFIGNNSIFDASVTDPEKYYWINGSPDTTQAFATTANTSLTFAYKGLGGNIPQGTYEIYLVTREGLCMDTSKVTFEVTYFYIPNLVTPNGDPYNERFEITNTGGRFDLEVFNRWGEKVYNEKGYTKNWDLAKISDGIYYYEVADTRSGKKYKGWVQVTR